MLKFSSFLCFLVSQLLKFVVCVKGFRNVTYKLQVLYPPVPSLHKMLMGLLLLSVKAFN